MVNTIVLGTKDILAELSKWWQKSAKPISEYLMYCHETIGWLQDDKVLQLFSLRLTFLYFAINSVLNKFSDTHNTTSTNIASIW